MSLKRRLDTGEFLIVYNGHTDNYLLQGADLETERFGKYHQAIRGRKENINGRLKRWPVLTNPFRHDKNLLELCF